MSYSQGVVSAGTSATPVCKPGPNGVLVQNLGTTIVYLGGPSVTATAAVLAPPSGLGAAANVGGGTFAAATYFWKITGTNAAGETTGSSEATVAVALNGTATLTWSALPAGTTGVKVYRGTVTNTENVLVATLGAVVTFTDTGAAGVAGTVPTASTATGTGGIQLPPYSATASPVLIPLRGVRPDSVDADDQLYGISSAPCLLAFMTVA